MTPETFRRIRLDAGHSDRSLERRLRLADQGGDYIRRLETGKAPISGPISLCMECLERGVLP